MTQTFRSGSLRLLLQLKIRNETSDKILLENKENERNNFLIDEDVIEEKCKCKDVQKTKTHDKLSVFCNIFCAKQYS